MARGSLRYSLEELLYQRGGGGGEAQKGQEPSPAASHAAFSLFWMEVQGAFGKRQERRGAPRGSRVPMPGVLGGGLLVTN